MKKYNLKRGNIILCIFIFVLMDVSLFASSQVTTVKGLLYLDNSPVSISIEDGKIKDIVRLTYIPDDFPDVYISPGFIDNQINGYKGVSFGSIKGKQLSVDDIKYAVKEIWKEGFTTFLPTLTTNAHDVLINNLSLLAQAMQDSCLLGTIPGVHLEGPYISPEEGFRGAHPIEYIRAPEWKEFMEYYIASGGKILQVTIAPEIKGALDFIKKCRKKNIVVSLGHHNASAQIIKAATDCGVQVVTHLGNGTANTINRHLNPFWPQLADDRLLISMICDGVHLLPEEIMVFYKVKGADKIIITSDVTYFAGLPVGNYTTPEGVKIKLTPEGKIWNPEKNILHGSAIPIRKGIGHVMCVTGCSLAEAVKMSSTNVANLYGLHDRGVIQPGKRADLALFTLGKRGIIQIKKTYVLGQLVYDADSEKK